MERNRISASRLAAAGFVVPKLPKVVRLEPASACNLHCIHCPTGVIKPQPGERGVMSMDLFRLILEELRKDLPDVVVLYHGGEPLLSKHFVDMVREVKALGVRFVKTVSNGVLLNEKVMRGIIEAQLDMIEFSLDGTSPEENDRIRVGADFHDIVARIRRLIDIREELGADKPQVFIANTQMIDGTRNSGGVLGVPQFLRDAFAGPYAEDVRYKPTYMIFWPGLNPADFERVETAGLEGEYHVNYCDHLVNTITIRWNGDVVPCCYDITSKYVIGNVRDAPLSELWNNERYRTLRESIYSGRYLPLCVNCPVVKPSLFMRLSAPEKPAKQEVGR